jgi:MFS family permease
MSQRNLRPFVLLQAASFVSLVSGSMTFMLMPWIAIQLTGSAVNAGLMVTITSIPGLILSPVMGGFIDRYGRRRVAILSELGSAVMNLVIAVLAAVIGLSLPALIAIAIIKTIVGSGVMSARKSLVPDAAAVGNLTLERANSIHESVAAAGFATGPAIASILVSSIGAFNTFYVVAALGAVAVLITLAIRVHEQHEAHDAEDEGRNWLSYSIQGFKVVFETPAILTIMSAFLVLAMIYLPTEMVVLPSWYQSIKQPSGLGFLLSVMAISTTVGSLLFERVAKVLSFANILRVAILGVSIGMLPMSLLPAQWAMLAFGVVLGLAWGPLPVLLNTVIQRLIPANKRGRVFSLEMTLWTAGPMISMTFAGMAVDAFGVRVVYPALAVLVLIASVIVSTRKSLADLNRAELVD